MERRFEFRIFDLRLGALAAAFVREGEEIGRDDNVSLYLVSRLNIDANVKFREGRLEVKTLECRLGQLELWRLDANEQMPVSGEFANTHVFSLLGLDHVDLPKGAMIGVGEISAIMKDLSAIRLLKLHKSRVQYRIGECLAEHVRIRFDGGEAESVALEADLSEPVQELIRRFALVRMENWSYPAFLQNVVFDKASKP